MLLKAYGTFDSGCKPIIFPANSMVTLDNAYVMAVSPTLFPLDMDRKNNMTNCSHDLSWNQGWCKFSNLPELYDYENDANSFVFGSSWNIIFAVTVFEWITASYALFYFDPFDSWLSYESLWWGIHPIPAICSVWNLFLIIFMWVYRTTLEVPPNNAFLYTMALGTTIVIHNFLSINRSWRIDYEKEDVAEGKGAYQLRTDIFLRQRKKEYQPLVKTIQADFHQPNYMILFEKCSCSPVPRYLEYLVTAPLLLASLYASSVPNDLTWKFQLIVLALMACNAIGIPLHYAVLNVSNDVQRYAMAAAYLLTGSWISLIAGLYIFIWTLRGFLLTNDSGMPQWVQMLVWAMLIVYSFFGIAASRYYLPRIMWSTNYGPEDYRWLSFYFDIFSLAIKLPVAWTIWIKGATLMCEHSVTCPGITM